MYELKDMHKAKNKNSSINNGPENKSDTDE